MSKYTDLLYEVSDHVATITLNRPDRLNAISGPMLASISQVFRDADADRDVRVIILTGAGRGFCAGLDLKDLTSGTGTSSMEFYAYEPAPHKVQAEVVGVPR
ncbi:enoyl-CoA hydratase/isomerase family protein [bacterium]|nr:enoyl-CoA hydratase/isomerase family protein [bacterium]